MPSPNFPFGPSDPPPPGGISEEESLEYSKELIESIQKIAEAQGHRVLGKLLDLAAQEAAAILRGEA